MDELEEEAAQLRQEIEATFADRPELRGSGSRCWRKPTRSVEKKANTPTTHGPQRH